MARRRSSYSYYFPSFEPTKPIEVKDGIKARSRRGEFVKNWWATRWIEALERLMDTGRLSRGRSYARKGQVLAVDETRTGITARVQGSRRTPYRVTIQVAPLIDDQWEKVIGALAEQALFAAQLLSGEMPQEIEETFESAGVSLFPAKRSDLVTYCSCPDQANPCKHIAATHYILGERFDEDPFLLFRLRGRTQEQILHALRRRRADIEFVEAENEEEEPEIVVPLELALDRFWELGQSLEQFSVSIQPPAVDVPLLKRLGEPVFVPEPGLVSSLGLAYHAISRAALKVAFEEDESADAKGEV
jgi:uncharacterized Zn finger protein